MATPFYHILYDVIALCYNLGVIYYYKEKNYEKQVAKNHFAHTRFNSAFCYAHHSCDPCCHLRGRVAGADGS